MKDLTERNGLVAELYLPICKHTHIPQRLTINHTSLWSSVNNQTIIQ